MLIPPDAQMFLSMTKAALALPILAGVGNSAAHVLKGTPDEGECLLGDSIVSQ